MFSEKVTHNYEAGDLFCYAKDDNKNMHSVIQIKFGEPKSIRTMLLKSEPSNDYVYAHDEMEIKIYVGLDDPYNDNWPLEQWDTSRGHCIQSDVPDYYTVGQATTLPVPSTLCSEA